MTHFRLIAAFLCAFGLAACERQAGAPPLTGVVALSDQFTGDFALIDKNSAAAADEDFEGRVMLVYFGFTYCPDVCPGDIAVMRAALNELGAEAAQIAPIFITVDPERDTPEALQAYFSFDPRIIALTGAPEALGAARKGFNLYAQKQLQPDSALEYTVDHQRMFFIADRNGQPRQAVVGGATAQELAEHLRLAIKEF